MASVFNMFRNSGMPKRLLRFALSRFDVLDADALNLDNLDLAWGRNTVLQFRDVGLKLEILQQLLQLPPTFNIRKAKVAILRVTIPVDVYSSPIQIHVTGVDVRLEIVKDGYEAGGKSGRRGTTKAGATSSCPDEHIVPTAADLAQDFLDRQSAQEKQAFEEALVATNEDDDDDDESNSSSSQTLGTGQALTLPAFLTSFLQGVADRIQVNIEGVTFQIEVDVPVEASAASSASPSGSAVPDGMEPVIFQLTLSRINVEGVTTLKMPTTPSNKQSDGKESDGIADETAQLPIVPKEGKRHISLENVRAFLISEANVFSTLARSSSMPSSLFSRAASTPSQEPIPRPSTSLSDSTTSHDLNSSVQDSGHSQNDTKNAYSGVAASTMASAPGASAMLQSQHGLQDSEDAFNIPYEMDSTDYDEELSTNINEPGCSEDDDADADEALASSTSTPRASVHGDYASGPMEMLPETFSKRVSGAAKSAILQDNHDQGLQFSTWGHEAQSEPFLRRVDPTRPFTIGSSTGSASYRLPGTEMPLRSPQHSVSGDAASMGSVECPDDLTQSQIYSHEEAESMYMSAFSHPDSSRTRKTMPGGWDNEDGIDVGGHYDHHFDNRSTISGSDRSGSVRADSPIPYDKLEDRHVDYDSINADQPHEPTAGLDHIRPISYTSPPASPPFVASVASPKLAGSRISETPSRRSSDSCTSSSAKLGHNVDSSEDVLEPSLYPSDQSLSSDGLLESLQNLQNVDEQTPHEEVGGVDERDTASQPDEAMTPRGPVRLAKEILALQYISIYVPSNHKPSDLVQENAHDVRVKKQQHPMDRSMAPHLPGAFSVYSLASASSVGASALNSRLDESQLLPQKGRDQPPPSDLSIEVTLSPLEIRFDTSIGYILAMAVSKLMQSAKTGIQQQQNQQHGKRGLATAHGSDVTAGPSVPKTELRAEKISLLFLDKLTGMTDTAERLLEPPQTSNFSQAGDILLQAVFENLVIGLSTPQSAPLMPVSGASNFTSVVPTLNTTIDLKRFCFGYADADIVSFDRRIQMRASVRDVFPLTSDDVSIKISQSIHKFKCEINTLPLLVSLDLQRLEETFSWFGGLSSFLSMGSSNTSAASGDDGGSRIAVHSKAKTPVPKSRGVHFEAPINPDDKSAAANNKIDMRIGGVHLDLVGRDCSVGLDASALKLVSREEGIGIGVSRIKLAGPHTKNSRGDPPVTAEVTNTRLEFLNVPKDKDLERLLELITPSRVKFDDREDVIMVDTLLRQRRNGPLLRVNVDDFNVHVHDIAKLSCLPPLGDEIARLATVTKYLPEDDRPGLLVLGLVRRMDLSADLGGRLGLLQAHVGYFETAHISVPSLISVAVSSLSVHRNHTEELIGSSLVPVARPSNVSAAAAVSSPSTTSTGILPETVTQSPALLLRFIGDDMEPAIKIKMWGLNFEYQVPTIMDLLGLDEDATPQDFEASLATSVANLGEQAHRVIRGEKGLGSLANETAVAAVAARDANVKPITLGLAFRDCMIGLNPLKLSSKLNIVLVDAHLEVTVPKTVEEIDTVFHLNKMSLLLVDDVSNLSSAKEALLAPESTANRTSAGVSFLTPKVSSKDVVSRLCARGFVDICQISAAKVSVHISAPDEEGQKTVDIEVRDDLLVLETCADSTQTLITLANGLKPVTPPSKEIKFKTQIMPVKDLLASISIDAFGRAEGNYNFDDDFILEEEDEAGEGVMDPGSEEDLYGVSSGGSCDVFANHGEHVLEESVASLPSNAADDDDLLIDDDLDIGHSVSGTVAEQLFNASSMFSEQTERRDSLTHSRDGNQRKTEAEPLGSSLLLGNSVSELGAEEQYFGTASDTAAEESSHANRWSSAQNNYDKKRKIKSGMAATIGGKPPPLCVRVRDVHVIWNLFDGYDWQRTRDIITKTVEEVEAKAQERRMRHRQRSGQDQYNPYSDDEEEEAVIGDFLFNSIYIGIPATHDPRELAQAINQNIYGDATGDTESIAATTISATSTRAGGVGGGGGGHSARSSRSKKLRLQRSRHHKITFELGGVAADLVVYPPGSGETQSSIDVRVHDLDVFDHVPTSTWKKFATYDRDAGERPIDGDMMHLEVLIVKPVPELSATEYVLKVSLLPLRLHVDQDALDFITRFFEFKDDSAPPTHASASDIPFIQRAEIRDIPVRLDFKPKRVDYAGLRSGHTTEFMNFLILDGSRMTMRHTIIYGISGFDRLGKTLNDIWMPDIKRHQLPGVLAGVAPVRSLVTVGSGFKDLIEIPIQEYRHNGRIVRSISKGAMAFAKSTGTELVKLGAKVATGTQYVLQGAEGILNKNNVDAPQYLSAQTGGIGGDIGEQDDSDDDHKQISLYADQPASVVQGLRHAYTSLARDLHVARDAIIAVPAEVRESTSATGAAKVVIKHAPTIIFRPAIGATKAIGQTLMGATNSLDPQNLRRAEDKYKSGPRRRI
ncbi:autophagy-related protein 2 [Sporothrix epigloea]|uniref:Autophagy-related protein 2 n=1 Tax=Sporothrix epigloea TaxID=1892477 RepID=A0ABP0DNN7_9PEZI